MVWKNSLLFSFKALLLQVEYYRVVFRLAALRLVLLCCSWGILSQIPWANPEAILRSNSKNALPCGCIGVDHFTWHSTTYITKSVAIFLNHQQSHARHLATYIWGLSHNHVPTYHAYNPYSTYDRGTGPIDATVDRVIGATVDAYWVGAAPPTYIRGLQ